MQAFQTVSNFLSSIYFSSVSEVIYTYYVEEGNLRNWYENGINM